MYESVRIYELRKVESNFLLRFTQQMDVPGKDMRKDPFEADVIDNTDIEIDPVRAHHIGLYAFAIPHDLWVEGAEYLSAPAVVDLDVYTLYVFIGVQRSEVIIVPVIVWSKYVRQIIIRAVVNANQIAERTFISERIHRSYCITTGNRK